MNSVKIVAITDNGRSAMFKYCSKFRNKRPSIMARIVNRALPYSEEVDDINAPSLIVVTLSKAITSQGHIIIPKIERSVFNILSKFGGSREDFEVIIS